MKKQTVIEVHTEYCNPLEKVNTLLEQGWLVKKVIVIRENFIHYLLEKEIREAD